MILNAWGVVLSRRDLGEADRLATLYTENLGKISVRFVGVNKPGRKLKALSEPMVWGEYRLYRKSPHAPGKAIGGRIISSFSYIRSDLSRTWAGLSCLELMSQLTPDGSSNAEKYRLICWALSELNAPEKPSPWLEIAYGLRLLELSGYGLHEIAVSPAEHPIWEALHSVELERLSEIPWQPQTAARCKSLLYGHVESQMGRPLKSRAFMETMALC